MSRSLTGGRLAWGAFVAAQFADAFTTVVGLELAGVREANPLAAAAVEAFGAPAGLALLSLVVVGVVTAVTEVGIVVLRYRGESDAWVRGGVRALGYGIPVATSLAAAAHNAVLLASVAA